jgi:hypothetical protein
LKSATPGVAFFVDILGKPREDRPFPYRLNTRMHVADLKTASGVAPKVSSNPEVRNAIRFADLLPP